MFFSKMQQNSTQNEKANNQNKKIVERKNYVLNIMEYYSFFPLWSYISIHWVYFSSLQEKLFLK